MEMNYGELFGVTPDTGENGQGVAAPAAEENTQSGKEQGVAAPAVEEPGAEGTRKPDEAGEPNGGGDEGGKQSRQERAAQAARRRQSEMEEAARKAREDAKKEAEAWLDQTLKGLGLSDPYTKKPITTKAELDAYHARHRTEERERIMKKLGMTPEAFDEFISSLPEVQSAKAAKMQADAAARAAQSEQFQQTVQAEMEEIRKLNPAIRELPDILQMETGEAFKGYVAKGYSYIDAYRLANYDTILSAAAEKGKREQNQREKGKTHLGRTTGHGAGAVTVPSDVMEEYRAFNPKATEAEIQAHWASLQRK